MTLEKEIIKAAKSGDAASIKSLLQEDPNLIHATDRDGSTPLHCASWKGHTEIVCMLRDAGSDIDAHNENGHWGTTPLHAAAHGKRKAVAECLINRGAAVNIRSPLNQLTALGHTKVHKATAVADILLQHGAEE